MGTGQKNSPKQGGTGKSVVVRRPRKASVSRSKNFVLLPNPYDLRTNSVPFAHRPIATIGKTGCSRQTSPKSSADCRASSTVSGKPGNSPIDRPSQLPGSDSHGNLQKSMPQPEPTGCSAAIANKKNPRVAPINDLLSDTVRIISVFLFRHGLMAQNQYSPCSCFRETRKLRRGFVTLPATASRQPQPLWGCFWGHDRDPG